MKAIIWTRYGSPDVLKLGELEKPVPKDNEVLIKVHATTVTAGDCEMRATKFPVWMWIMLRLYVGLFRPVRLKVLGQELAGEVVAAGKDVEGFKHGDQVFGNAGFRLGAYAEYACLPAQSDTSVLVVKPPGLPFEEAAAIPTGGLEALHFLRLAQVQPGERVLVNGAGGSIGAIGVQLAKGMGAEVTAVDSAAKHAMLRSLGADHVIDYVDEDFTRNGQIYDVIFDVVGKSHFARSLRSLAPGGRYLIANPTISKMLRGALASRLGDKQVFTQVSSPNVEDLTHLADLVSAGSLRIVVDRVYSLDDVAEAHHYVETGQKQGNVVIRVKSNHE